MIYNKEVPFILTILFGVLGYTLNTFSDRLYEYSFVEYKYLSGSDENGKYLGYKIKNATNDKVYRNLIFSILAEEESGLAFLSGKIIPGPPLYQRNVNLSRTKPQELGETYANFKLEFLIPDAKYFVRLYYEGEMTHRPELLFRLSEMEDEGVDLSDPVIFLKEASFLTWLGKNQFDVLTGLIIL